MNKPTFLLQGRTLDIYRRLRDLRLELEDRMAVIGQRYNHEIEEVTRVIAEEAGPLREELMRASNLPVDQKGYWYFDDRYFDKHGMVIMFFNEEVHGRDLLNEQKGKTIH